MNLDETCDRALDAFVEGDYERAAAAYRRALEAAPNHADALHGLAQVYARQGKLEEAIALVRHISRLDPDDILAHTSLSRFLQAQGKVPEAEAEANKARILGWRQQLKQQKEGKASNLIKLGE